MAMADRSPVGTAMGDAGASRAEPVPGSTPRALALFGPRERRGLVAGFRTGQAVAVAGGLLGAVVLLRLLPGTPGVVAGLAACVAGAGLAALPVGGRAPEEWLPVVTHFLVARRPRGPWVVPPPASREVTARGPRPPTSPRLVGGARREHAVPALAGCSLIRVAGSAGGAELGAVHDARCGTLVGVLRLTSTALALASGPERTERALRWGALLGAIAAPGSGVHRVAWMERTQPVPLVPPAGAGAGAGAAMLEPPQEQVVPPGLTPASDPRSEPTRSSSVPPAASRSYAELLSDAGDAWAHELFLAVAVRSGGPGTPVARAENELTRVVRRVERELVSLGFGAGGPLDPYELGALIRSSSDAERACRVAPLVDGGFVWPWPLAAKLSWRSLRLEGTWHATYWVAEWPRQPVEMDFLTPLLALGGLRRTVVTVLEPVPAERARREVEAARTSAAADDELRRRGGFAMTARHRRQAELLARRESELADGHAPYRCVAFVGVSADGPQALEEACRAVEQAAALAQLQLRRLWGQADEAFTWTLPLARGL